MRKQPKRQPKRQPNEANDTGGAPSPSGDYIAFTHRDAGTSAVYRANTDGTGRQRLTAGYQPDWQSVS